LSLSQSPSVVIITASTGRPDLRRCAQSVQQQDFDRVRHLVVVDGPEYAAAAAQALDGVGAGKQRDVMVLPWNAGHKIHYGYRVYGAMSCVVDEDIVCFLDEDNWLDSGHVSAAAAALLATGADWAYTLRRIWTHDGEPVADDDCDSLGYWPRFASMLSVRETEPRRKAWPARNPHLVDTNCYALPRPLALAVAPLMQEAGADSVVASLLVQQHAGACTGTSTVNYALGGGSGLRAGWFTDGNDRIRQLYGSAALPWRQAPRRLGPGPLGHPPG
jgi:hypothetical protein